MESMNAMPSGGMTTMPEPPKLIPEPEQKSGPLFWIVAALMAAVVGAFAWFYFTIPEAGAPAPIDTARQEQDAPTTQLMMQGASDEVGAIEADLTATDLSGLDQELSSIDSELSAQ